MCRDRCWCLAAITATFVMGCTDVMTPVEQESEALPRGQLSAAVFGTKLGDGGFESSSQSQGVPTGWTENFFWGGTEGPGIDPGPPPTFLTNPEQCIVPTGGYCTGGRFVYSGYFDVGAVLDGLPGSGNFGIAFTRDFVWINPKFPGIPQEPDQINAFIIKAGSRSNFTTRFEPFTGTWELGLAIALMTSDVDQGSDATLDFLRPNDPPIQLLRVLRDPGEPIGIEVQAFSTPSVTPFPNTTTACATATYAFCSGWHIVSFDVTALAGTGYTMRIIANEEPFAQPHTVDAPIAFAFDDISLQATLAATGAEGASAIGLIAPHASYMRDDPQTQALTHSWTLDANAVGCTLINAATATPSVTGCADNGVVPVRVTISFAQTPEGGGPDVAVSETVTGTITITNEAPVLGSIVDAPIDPVPINSVLPLSAGYTDAGTLDMHTAALLWDGVPFPCTASNGIVDKCSTPSTPGVYTIQLTLSDDDGATVLSDMYSSIAVYDPNTGHVTGGGWINSPAGAYVPQPSTIGKATFGFVSRYKRGATVPSGTTEFQFHAGNLNFRSTQYEKLIVAGARAQFMGDGTIDGNGSYGFKLTAVDGELAGVGQVDRFRIKIWDRATNVVIYDNEMGESDEGTPATVLGGGSIVIHKQ